MLMPFFGIIKAIPASPTAPLSRYDIARLINQPQRLPVN